MTSSEKVACQPAGRRLQLRRITRIGIFKLIRQKTRRLSNYSEFIVRWLEKRAVRQLADFLELLVLLVQAKRT